MNRRVEEVIRDCQLFTEVAPERCQKLAEIALTREFAKQQMIFRQGQDCPGVFIVDTGLVRVFKTSPAGKEHVLHMVMPGQTFAEVASIGNFACPAHAEAVEPTRCILIPNSLFRQHLASDHSLCLEMMTGMSFWVRRLISLMEDLVLRDALGRLASFLLDTETDDEGMVRLPSLKRHVASHLNLSSETFSRTLGRLIEAGIIVEHDKNRVQVRQPLQLRAISEGRFPEI
jgi:CRP/FNR family transcriptional regulator